MLTDDLAHTPVQIRRPGPCHPNLMLPIFENNADSTRNVVLEIVIFQLRRPSAVPIQRVPSDETSKETMAELDSLFPVGGVHGTKRTPSYFTSPESVPIQI